MPEFFFCYNHDKFIKLMKKIETKTKLLEIKSKASKVVFKQ